MPLLLLRRNHGRHRSWQRVQRAQAHRRSRTACHPECLCTSSAPSAGRPADAARSARIRKEEGRSGYSPLRPERARPFDRGGFYPLRMCVGGLHVILWASRRAGVHSRNRGRSLDSYCRRQIRPGSRIRPPVLEFQTKDRVWIRQLEKAPHRARPKLIAAATCNAANLVGQVRDRCQ